MTLNEPAKKRKKVSKNKKKNWSKIDITDVEEQLEAERIQLRTGGLAEEKPDEQLFFVDKQDAVTEDTQTAPKRKLRERKPMKCHANLTITTGSKPVIVSTVVADSKKKKKTGIKSATQLKQKEEERQQRMKQSKSSFKVKADMRRENAQRVNNCKDLWAEEAPKNPLLVYVKKQPVKVPSSMKKKVPSVLPAVEVAHPGQSYNPSVDDHKDLIQIAGAVEVRKEKERMKLKRALDDAFPSAEDAPTQASYIAEMSAGIFVEPGEEEEEEDDVITNPPVRRENKKTERQRKKEAARKQKEVDRLKAKDDKLSKQDFFRIKSMKKEIRAKKAKIAEKVALRAEQAEADKSKTKRLSKYKYEDPSIPVKLSHELEQSLRLLKPEGHLVEDRFKSLQKRNIIETRQRQKMKRKYKPKTFEKKLHKAVSI